MKFLAQEFTVKSKGWNRCVMLLGTFTRRILASASKQCDKERFPNLFTPLNIAHYQLLHRTGGVKMKVEGLNHIFHIYIPYIPLMIEQKSLFSQKVGGGGGLAPPGLLHVNAKYSCLLCVAYVLG